MGHPAVGISGITKYFGDLAANRNVDIEIQKQSIHALVGENGAGKSTVMKILYGMYAPDSGTIRINGVVRNIKNPHDAIHLGIGMVHQHFMLIPGLTVAENVVLGHETVSGIGRLCMKEARSRISEIAEQYGLPVDPLETVENLSVGQQQRVEILKTLYRNADILILDEPTAVLTPLEVKAFFKTLENLKASGKTIVIITHKLEEVMALADFVTVMRGGEKVGDLEISDASVEKMARMMVGRDVLLRSRATPSKVGEEVLRVDSLCTSDGKLKNISLQLGRGEILGIAGVSGNGQTELELALTGLAPISSGEIFFKGVRMEKITPLANRKSRIAHIPSDREKLGYIHSFSNANNLVLGYHGFHEFCRAAGFVKTTTVQRTAAERIAKYNLMPPKPGILTTNLSGGNKQKLVVAREFEPGPVFMIIAEPTRGVDIGAIEFIHKKILELRDQGAAILLISAELEEIKALSSRALVMFEGEISGRFGPDDFDETRVALMMTGNQAKTA